MIDPNLLRYSINDIAKKLALRGFKLDINKLRALEERRKKLQIKTENIQAQRNLQSKYIGIAKINGENINTLCLEVKKLGKELNKTKIELNFIKAEINKIELSIPNIADVSVPIGKDQNDNVEVKKWGTPRNFNFKILDHVKLGEIHNGLDFITAVKLTGSRFVVMKGQIANMHRALIQFMLDLHIEQHGYNEIYVPYLVNNNTLFATGHIPKFEEDLFSIKNSNTTNNNYFLIPTAEVPLTNLVRNHILKEEDLPIKMIAHSPCFRSEAGSYGRDTRGLIRMHQFDKIEMVQIVNPKLSMIALEEMTNHAEKVLELLKLPYRRVVLCTGDMSFCACKAYDIEVWIPTENNYREVSSCSNIWDFQARRMQSRFYSNKSKNKTFLVHTINGSGLAIGRTLVAVMENYQQANGQILIPKVLRPYMKGQKYISKN